MRLSVFDVFLWGVLLMSKATLATETVKTFGYVPSIFPRDTVDFNFYMEHVAIGQVVTPLVSTDLQGNIIPGVAKKWTFSNGGKTVTFELKKDLKFSNGDKVNAKDVVYSLNRHLTYPKSQSYPYLKSIESIKANDNMVIITMEAPKVAIIKILSRDQLGVVPEGWQFKGSSIKPFIGTGPYNLVKKKHEWYFETNPHYIGSAPSVGEWKILARDEKNEITEPASVVFSAHQEEVDRLKKDFDIEKTHDLKDTVTFSQDSAWWFPHGKSFSSTRSRKFKMAVFSELIKLRRSSLKMEEATGVIPKGVAGYSQSVEVVTDTDKLRSEMGSLKKPIPIKVGMLTRLKETVFIGEDLSQIESKYSVKFELFEITKFEKLVDQKVDIVFAGWAGGFNDPEGFLPVLPILLQQSLEDYLSSDLKALLAAGASEQDWSKRSNIYKDFNQLLVKKQVMVPAWKGKAINVIDKRLRYEDRLFRYTPRLLDVKFK